MERQVHIFPNATVHGIYQIVVDRRGHLDLLAILVLDQAGPGIVDQGDGAVERTPDGQRRLSSMNAVPKVETLMAKWDPDIVVVQTGTNRFRIARSDQNCENHSCPTELIVGALGS